jgi:hypothetical protein
MPGNLASCQTAHEVRQHQTEAADHQHAQGVARPPRQPAGGPGATEDDGDHRRAHERTERGGYACAPEAEGQGVPASQQPRWTPDVAQDQVGAHAALEPVGHGEARRGSEGAPMKQIRTDVRGRGRREQHRPVLQRREGQQHERHTGGWPEGREDVLDGEAIADLGGERVGREEDHRSEPQRHLRPLEPLGRPAHENTVLQPPGSQIVPPSG